MREREKNVEREEDKTEYKEGGRNLVASPSDRQSPVDTSHIARKPSCRMMLQHDGDSEPGILLG